MVDGKPVPARGGGIKPVRFMCLNPDDDALIIKMLYQSACDDLQDVRLSWLFGTEWILLCPGSFRLGNFLNSNACPKVRNNKLVPNDPTMGNANLFASVIHELAHVYGANHQGELNANHNEVYNIQDAIDLPASTQIYNAANYGLFASSGCSLYLRSV